MKKKILPLLAFVGALPIFAEDPPQSADYLGDWIETAKTTMQGWGGQLAPLFGVGVILVLLFLGWKLFKKTTNKAT